MCGRDERDLIVAGSIVVDVVPNKTLSLSLSLSHINDAVTGTIYFASENANSEHASTHITGILLLILLLILLASCSSASIRSGLEIRNMSIIGVTHVHCSI
jgi:hypothetical protein